jgi:LmbE family N-acetylglucosaminyl deacetylase
VSAPREVSQTLGPSDRVLLLAPHPDDEILAAGVLLRRAVETGATVRVVLATDGEGNEWVERLVERRLRIRPDARARFAERRREEALAALDRIGVAEPSVVSLGLPDTGLTGALLAGDERPAARIGAAVDEFSPTLLLVPSLSDTHPDHSALGVWVQLALDRPDRVAARPEVLEYVVHGPLARRAPADVVVVPTRAERDAKCAAILCHRTPMAAHRREFLARAHDPERFRRVAPPGRAHGRHPIRDVAVDAGGWILDLVSHPRIGAWGRRTLHLLGARDGRVERLAADLPCEGEAPLSDASGAARGAIRVERRPSTVRIRVPSVLGPASRAWAKVERAHGFYDEGGWIELPGAALHATPATARPAARSQRDGGVCAVVPCFNVEAYCGPVVLDASRRADVVIAVDDGSTDGTRRVLDDAARAAGPRLHVLSLSPNRGKGVALLEAFRHALEHVPFSVLVTLDSDGQHRTEDIAAVVDEWRRGSDLAIGGRGSFDEMPMRSRFGNAMTAAVLRRFYPRCPRDTQCGLRAHDRSLVAEAVATLAGRRYETELEILLLALSRGHRVTTVSIPAIYLDRNRSSHFRPLVDSARIYRTLAAWEWRRRVGPRGRAASAALSPPVSALGAVTR